MRQVFTIKIIYDIIHSALLIIFHQQKGTLHAATCAKGGYF